MEQFRTALRRLLGGDHPERLSEMELADLGLSRADVAILQNGAPGARVRLEKMAAQFGVSPADIDRDRGIALDLAETCARCDEARRCMQAIKTGQKLDEDNCPNSRFYKILSDGDDGRSATLT